MKKFLVLLIMLIAAVMLTCAAADAPTVYTSGDFKYTLQEDGTAEITDYTGKETKLTIPATLDGHSVTSIGGLGFFDCNSLTSITIPDSVTAIGDRAFSFCFSLTSITIPDSVTSIGANPFDLCSALTKIVVSPDHPTLATIDGVLFEKPTKTLISYPSAFAATSYTIPQGIMAIGDSAFSFCSKLTSITIPNSVTSIGDSAFSNCGSLTAITIPNSVTSIGTNPFVSCDKLTSIIVSVDHPTLAAIDGVLLEKNTKTLICYPCASEVNSYAIPQGIKVIGDTAFSNCRFLTSVTIPDSITSIGDRAFYHCSNLTSITIPDSVTSIGDEAFNNCRSLTTITIPDSVTSIGDSAFSNCRSLTAITVGRDSYARQYCIDNGLPYTYHDANDWLLN